MTTHTEGRLTVRPNGDANSYALIDDAGKWCMSLLLNGEQMTERQEANMRRLAACWNAFVGATTEAIEELGPMAGVMCDPAQSRIFELEAERDTLLAAVDEWFCDACNTVFPLGHVKGLKLTCSCGAGTLRPSSVNQREVEAERDTLLQLLHRVTQEPSWTRMDPPLKADIAKTLGMPETPMFPDEAAAFAKASADIARGARQSTGKLPG